MSSFPRTFFAIASVLTALLGGWWLVAPGHALAQWDATAPDAMAVYMGRRYGGMFMGYTVLLWLARATAASPAGRTIAVAGTAVTAAMTALSAWGALSGVAGPTIWGAVAIEAVLAACFARIWLRG